MFSLRRIPRPLKSSTSHAARCRLESPRPSLGQSHTAHYCRLFSASSISDPFNKLQVYSSLSTNPYINLSIEHHLLTHSPPDSRILLLYTNRPSVIIGRNQNPWLEVNLPLLARIRDEPSSITNWHHGPVDLVRRRSGGGAVFHDAGNVNFSVICPPAEFDRDKHALMVVRALSALGKGNTRVNARHDIVMDLPPSSADTETTQVRKISGSAYKLTRFRALHHGTCLLQSPNLAQISPLLRSPAAPFITALGSPSVRSPVANVGLEPAAFMDAVALEFGRMYGDFDVHLQVDVDERGAGGPGKLPWHEISKGVEELQSKAWIYGQTPRFSFNSTDSSSSENTVLPPPISRKIFFDTRHGKIENIELDDIKLTVGDCSDRSQVHANLWECRDWSETLSSADMSESEASSLGSWLNQVLGTDFSSK
ncbi:hypothetical protein NLU13_4427 [Sarocladium strictum]|uniref:Putative lipoate-protein ligase A n=1 Tax=Sarocladium strictum TaxID=5046 RepID=A0AA39GLF3_SARSR|nr:hypothetical protein NLU13_4427 [Sarocladium strictum]